MLPRVHPNPRRVPSAAPGTPATSAPPSTRVLPEQLRARWRRACVHDPGAAAFTEDCLDVWFSHLRTALDVESCGHCTCGCCTGGTRRPDGGPDQDEI